MACKRVKWNLLGIKISFRIPCHSIKNYGKSNIISIDKGVEHSIKIKGNNNRIVVTSKGPCSRILKINICGNNNNIVIKNPIEAGLWIDIGNFTGVDNVNIEIDENLTCAQASILAYQNNVPVSIGKNCLFSNDIVIRAGELPHKIFDATTGEDIDKSDGIVIGDHVWIGEHSYIMKHAKISDNSIVGSMSVVTKRFEEQDVVIAGNPAKICKRNVRWAHI